MAAKIKALTYASAEGTYWRAQPVLADAILTDSGAAVLGASRVTCSYTRAVPAGLREDRAVFGLWVSKIVGGNLFSMIPLAELAALEPALTTAITTMGTWQASSWTCVEFAWHQVNMNSPRDQTGRGQIMGPATRVTTVSITPTGYTQSMPHQVASTVTLRTVSRRHWGRSYLPAMSPGGLQTSFGRWTNTVVDGLAGAVNTLHNTWQDAGYQLGVYSMLHPAFLTPITIEADDIPDIVRRRRPKQMNYRKLL